MKMKLKLRKAIALPPVTVSNSKDMINALINAKYHGQTFTALGSSHLCCDAVFIASLVKERREERAILLKEKASHLADEKLEGEALAILESLDGDAEKKKKLKVVELQKLMSFYGVERKKQAKTAAGLRKQFESLRENNASPKAYLKWTDDDEAKLLLSMNENVSVDDTILGKERAKLRKRKEEHVASLTREIGKEAVLNLINRTIATDSPEGADMIVPTSLVTPLNLCGRMESI